MDEQFNICLRKSLYYEKFSDKNLKKKIWISTILVIINDIL